jgi:hypothetical protein
VVTVVTAVTVLTVAFSTNRRDGKVKVERGKVVAMVPTIGGWLDPRAGLDILGENNFLA